MCLYSAFRGFYSTALSHTNSSHPTLWLILCALKDPTSVSQNIQGIITSDSVLAPLHTVIAKQLHTIDRMKQTGIYRQKTLTKLKPYCLLWIYKNKNESI